MSNYEEICFMGNNEPITLCSGYTNERNVEKIDKRDLIQESLTEDELKRLSKLKAKVESAGTPSVLNKEELRDYESLGLRYNLLSGEADGVLLPTAIEPHITN
jgi:hypothetical protein